MSASRLTAPGSAATDCPVLRRASAADCGAFSAFLQGLSHGSRRLRFHGACSGASTTLARQMCAVDGVQHQAWLAWAGCGEQAVVVGEARFVVSACGRSAELAITVADAWQGHGLAAMLMHTLLVGARAAGVVELYGEVLNTNLRMQTFMQRQGFETDGFGRDDVLRMRRNVHSTPAACGLLGALAGLGEWVRSLHALLHLGSPATTNRVAGSA